MRMSHTGWLTESVLCLQRVNSSRGLTYASRLVACSRMKRARSEIVGLQVLAADRRRVVGSDGWQSMSAVRTPCIVPPLIEIIAAAVRPPEHAIVEVDAKDCVFRPPASGFGSCRPCQARTYRRPRRRTPTRRTAIRPRRPLATHSLPSGAGFPRPPPERRHCTILDRLTAVHADADALEPARAARLNGNAAAAAGDHRLLADQRLFDDDTHLVTGAGPRPARHTPAVADIQRPRENGCRLREMH